MCSASMASPRPRYFEFVSSCCIDDSIESRRDGLLYLCVLVISYLEQLVLHVLTRIADQQREVLVIQYRQRRGGICTLIGNSKKYVARNTSRALANFSRAFSETHDKPRLLAFPHRCLPRTHVAVKATIASHTSYKVKAVGWPWISILTIHLRSAIK